MTAIAPEPTTTNTTAPSVDWQTNTLANGTEYTSAIIGAVTVAGTTATVILDLNPGWFATGRAKGRHGRFLTGPDLTSGPDFTLIGYRVERADVTPGRYLAAAPAALVGFRPHLVPGLVWEPVAASHVGSVALLAVLHTPGGDVPVYARHMPVQDLLVHGEDTVTVSRFAAGTRMFVPVTSRDVDPVSLLDRVRRVGGVALT
jgi:hypothetical protein